MHRNICVGCSASINEHIMYSDLVNTFNMVNIIRQMMAEVRRFKNNCIENSKNFILKSLIEGAQEVALQKYFPAKLKG